MPFLMLVASGCLYSLIYITYAIYMILKIINSWAVNVNIVSDWVNNLKKQHVIHFFNVSQFEVDTCHIFVILKQHFRLNVVV